jgi:FkbM family methyltransferase
VHDARFDSVVVTAYDRPDGLARLLDDLEREGLGGERVHIYDDASPQRDRALERRIAALGCRVHRAERNHGKQRWWEWWNAILAGLEGEVARDGLVLVLQDDVRLCRDFTRRTLELYRGIDDPDRATLHLHVTAERGGAGSQCWTGVRAEPCGQVVRTGWVDMGAFVAHRRLFETLGWRLDEVPSTRWARHQVLGSGVGEQVSRRAHAAGLGMYQVRQSLVVHDHSPSRMNAAARARWPMRTVGFVDGDVEAARLAAARPAVLASVASIPSRTDWLREVVARLRPQVDRLLVYLNGYPAVPAYLDDERITVVRSADRGDRGDAGKFFAAGRHTGVHVLCDDDIAYPEDHVERLLAGLDRYQRRAVVGFHASTLQEPFTDYLRTRTITHMSRGVAADVGVHVLGTGTAAYHSSAVRVRRRDFRTPNMADVWFALLGQRQQVPFVQLRREDGWLRELGQVHGTTSDGLYARARRDRDGRALPETAAVLSHQPWQVFPATVHDPRPAPGSVPQPRPVPPPARLVRVHVLGPSRTAVLALPKDDHITVAVQRTGTYYERDLLDAVRDLGLGGVYVDIGAHHGNHTTYFALECGADRVVAVEPDAAALHGLRETLAENRLTDRVDVRPVAVHPTWRRVSPVPIHWRRRRDGAATNTGIRRFRSDARGTTEAQPMDAVLGDLAGVTLVKVDAGGLSGEILASGRRTLLRDRPAVVAAASSPGERSALRTALEPLGYGEVERFGWSPTWLWSPQPVRA